MSDIDFFRAEEIVKRFPGVIALDGVNLQVMEGEIHALIGENGAGKSTLIKILAGAEQPDSGKIIYKNVPYKGYTNSTALEMGITAIYQEFNLIPSLSIAENVFLGREMMKGPFIDYAGMYRETNRLFTEMGLKINPKVPVKYIGVAYQQIVEIIKAVSVNSRILIMDEPTAPLTNTETEALFKLINALKAKGVTIIYISHRLEEVFKICDRVTVMRDGRHIVTLKTNETDKKQLISYMVGRELGEDYPARSNKPALEEVLSVHGVSAGKVKNISLKVKKGEIVGLGGLVGSGRTELVRLLFGADALESGEIWVKGKVTKISDPASAIRNGIVLIPEDRKGQGLVLGMDVKSNITIGAMQKVCRGLFIDQFREKKLCDRLRDDLKIKTPTMAQKVKNLSGGNQQKVVLAKWLSVNCDILIFDEPTRGIDVGTKQEIYLLMNELVALGKSILMVSSEMPELIGMSDRIYVMHEGKIAGELNKENITQEAILFLASGQDSNEEIGG